MIIEPVSVFLIGMILVVGLFIGSFLNLVIWRVPAGESVLSPRSACPDCGHEIRARDNVPVLSWLLLKRRCRDCSTPISERYLLIEASTAVFFVLVALGILGLLGAPFETVAGTPSSENGTGPADAPSSGGGMDGILANLGSLADVWAGVIVTVAFLYLAAVSVALTVIDIDVQRLPNVIVLPSIVVGAALLTVVSALSEEWGAIIRALIGSVVLFVFYYLLALIQPKGMGFGDVKLAALLGLYLGFVGWGALVAGAFSAFLLGGIYSIGLLIFRRAGRKTGIPFGPWMLLGAWASIFFGERIASGYFALFGLH